MSHMEQGTSTNDHTCNMSCSPRINGYEVLKMAEDVPWVEEVMLNLVELTKKFGVVGCKDIQEDRRHSKG